MKLRTLLIATAFGMLSWSTLASNSLSTDTHDSGDATEHQVYKTDDSTTTRQIDPDNQCTGSSGTIPHGLCMKCATKPGLFGIGKIALCCIGNACDELQQDGWTISTNKYRDCSLDFSIPFVVRCVGGSC